MGLMANTIPDVREVARNIYLIDSECAFLPGLFSSYLINEEKKALVDVGSPSAAVTLLNGLKKIGVDPREIDYIILTHVHLDHSGGAGILMKDMPQAKVLTHPGCTKHLIDPTRLVNSSLEVQKGTPNEALRYDLTLPVESSRIKDVKDGESISLGPEQQITFIYTPGHASYHLSIGEERNNGIFVGETLGLKIGNDIMPITTRPTDLDSAFTSIEKLISLKPDILYFPHWGVETNAKESMQRAKERRRIWYDTVLEAIEKNPDNVMEELRDFICSESDFFKKQFNDGDMIDSTLLLSINGHIDYLKRRKNTTDAS